MIRYFSLTVFFIVLTVVTIAGWRGMKTQRPPIELFPDMDRQPKLKSQKPSSFFANGMGNRMPVEGTIERKTYPASVDPQYLEYYRTGQLGAFWGEGFPLAINQEDLNRGQQRYNIYCSACHGKTGYGDGVVKNYGLATIVSLQEDRIREMADGEIFHTITNGKNTMGAYGSSISVEDRWKIIAYLRTLQLSQQTPWESLPPSLQAALPREQASQNPEAGSLQTSPSSSKTSPSSP